MENPKLMTRELSSEHQDGVEPLLAASDSRQSPGNSEMDYIDNIKKVLQLALERYISLDKDKEHLFISRFTKIQVILSDITILEKIRKMFSYMDLKQFNKFDKLIIKMFLQQPKFLEALFEKSDDIEEHYKKLAIEIHKFLNEYGVQAVLPFQFQDKIQRRLDSLARILTPHSRFSVCVALTIVGKELYISANHEGYETDICANYIWNKLVLFRDFFKQLPSEYYRDETFEIYKTSLNEKIHAFLNLLINEGGTSISQEILMQAVQKSIFACGSLLSEERAKDDERESFNQNERFAILDNPVANLLVPSKRRDEEAEASKTLHFTVFKTGVTEDVLEDQTVSKTEHVLGEFKPSISIRYIHCEQLLIYFLKKINVGMDAGSASQIGFLRLGISKLCCQTCIIAIDEWNQKKAGNFQVAVRGCHEKTYDNVVNLFSPQAFSLPSPKKSPSKSAARTFNEFSEIGGVNMIVFFSPKQPLPEKTENSHSLASQSKKREREAKFGETTPKRLQGGSAEFFDNLKPFVSPNTPYQNSPSIQNDSGLAEERVFQSFPSLIFPSSLIEGAVKDEKATHSDGTAQFEMMGQLAQF